MIYFQMQKMGKHTASTMYSEIFFKYHFLKIYH